MKYFNIIKGIVVVCLAFVSGTVLVVGGNLLVNALLDGTEAQHLDEYPMSDTLILETSNTQTSYSYVVTTQSTEAVATSTRDSGAMSDSGAGSNPVESVPGSSNLNASSSTTSGGSHEFSVPPETSTSSHLSMTTTKASTTAHTRVTTATVTAATTTSVTTISTTKRSSTDATITTRASTVRTYFSGATRLDIPEDETNEVPGSIYDYFD